MISTEKQEFLRLVEIAIDLSRETAIEANKKNIQWLEAQSRETEIFFVELREKILNDELVRSCGAGLGISRALGEWAPDNLLDAGNKVEDYFRHKWR